jgi:hypothetical protein
MGAPVKFPQYAGGKPATDTAAPEAPPAACPSCKSPEIATTAKKPDEGSYWRCSVCGEVWNPGRRQRPRW